MGGAYQCSTRGGHYFSTTELACGSAAKLARMTADKFHGFRCCTDQ